MNLVSQAYSSISLAEFSTYVGLGELEAGELASQQVKFCFYEKATKIWKNIQLVLTLLSKKTVVKKSMEFYCISSFVEF